MHENRVVSSSGLQEIFFDFDIFVAVKIPNS